MTLPFVAELDALREAGRVAIAVAGERGPRHVDAVVDDRDADAVARGGDAAGEPAPERAAPRRRSAPRSVWRVVGHGGPHALDAGHAREARQLAARQRDDERVHDRASCARARAGRARRARSRCAAARCSRAISASARRGPRRCRSTCPRASRSCASGARSATGGPFSSTTTSARADDASASPGAVADASSAPSATRRARAGSVTRPAYPDYPPFALHAVEHVTAQPVSGREARVVEIVGRVVRHADAPHDRLRAHVRAAS